MTVGVIAMIAAMEPEVIDTTDRDNTDKGVGRPQSLITKTAKASGVSHGTMTKAFAVKEYADDLAQADGS
jgi:hypothetical protein